MAIVKLTKILFYDKLFIISIVTAVGSKASNSLKIERYFLTDTKISDRSFCIAQKIGLKFLIFGKIDFYLTQVIK